MMEDGKILNAFDLCIYLDTEEEYVVYTPVYGDRDYDYGFADDGTPRPGPCPVCGAPDWTCVYDYYAQQEKLQVETN